MLTPATAGGCGIYAKTRRSPAWPNGTGDLQRLRPSWENVAGKAFLRLWRSRCQFLEARKISRSQGPQRSEEDCPFSFTDLIFLPTRNLLNLVIQCIHRSATDVGSACVLNIGKWGRRKPIMRFQYIEVRLTRWASRFLFTPRQKVFLLTGLEPFP